MRPTPSFLLASLVFLAALPGPFAHAADANDYSEGSLGAGLSANGNSESGYGGASAFRVGVKLSGLGRTGNGSPLHWLDAELTFNALGASKEGFSTGASVHFEGLVGGQLLGFRENGCGFYAGFGAQGEVNFVFNRNFMSRITGYAGPESGIICQVPGVVVMAGPSVGAGFAGVGRKLPIDSLELNSDDVLFAGGRVRVLLDEMAMISASANVMPDVVNDSFNDHTSFEGAINAEIKPTKDQPWMFGFRAKALHLEPIAGDAARGAKQNAVTGGEAGVTASMTF